MDELAAIKKRYSFQSLIGVMEKLRSPAGCPWDREQTHNSLLKYLKEESAEVEEAVRKKDWDNLEEELADILLQVLFHAQIAKEKGRFDIHDVVDTLAAKLVLRHPHVFEKKGRNNRWTADDVRERWKELKDREKRLRLARKKSRRKVRT